MTVAQQIEKRGMKQGMKTRDLAIASNMLKDKEPQDKVSKFTGLSKQELEKLVQELGLN